MFGLDPSAMLRMGLQMVDLDNQEQINGIVAELQKIEFEPGEKEKVITLLRLALGAMGATSS